MATFLFKTEPGTYSFDDLVRDKRGTWDGVSNNQALITLRAIRAGDSVLIYHTGDEKAIVGSAIVTKGAFEDPKQPGKTPSGEPKFAVVEIRPDKKAKSALTLSAIKGDKRFAEFALVKHSRLSVMLVPPELDRVIRSLTGL